MRCRFGLDCDVIQADGGTRTAAITGAYVSLHRAFERLVALGVLNTIPLTDAVAAVSCGIYRGAPILDLDYAEDSGAEADANFVLTARGGIVEIQATGEERPFNQGQLADMLALARRGVRELIRLQRRALARE